MSLLLLLKGTPAASAGNIILRDPGTPGNIKLADVAGTLTKTVVVTALLQHTELVTTSAAAVLQHTVTIATTATSVLQQTGAKTVTATAVLRQTVAVMVTTAAVLRQTEALTVGATASLSQATNLTCVVAAVLQRTEVRTVGATAHLVLVVATTVTATTVLAIRQFARPEDDVTTGAWATSSGSGTLASHIDEEVPGHAVDYIESSAPPSNDTARVTLTPISQPQVGTVYLRLRIRRRP